MKTLYMLKGLPASGKTGHAHTLISDLGAGNAKRVNKDELRAMLDLRRWSPSNERFVLAARDACITLALLEGKSVVVDDTNLHPRHLKHLSGIAETHGAQVEVVDLTHVPMSECIKRDRARANGVGEGVIKDMYVKYICPPPPAYDPAKPMCVICDIDGTIATVNGRDWDDPTRYFEDKVVPHVLDTVQRMCAVPGVDLLFITGRYSKWRQVTFDWLRQIAGLGAFALYMREDGDNRKDFIIKRELYQVFVEPKYNVHVILEDRPRVIMDCWQALGFADRIFNCGTGQEF